MILILIIKEVEYAIQILDELYHEGSLSAAELSARRDIPSPFIYRVLKKLETAGILDIKRGPKGGYRLSRDCGRLTLYDVINAFENTFLVVECMKDEYDCTNNPRSDCCMHCLQMMRMNRRRKTETHNRRLQSPSFLLSVTHHHVTTAMMTAAPNSANIPGTSPTNIATHTGLKSGSSIPIREHARGGQSLDATA